jgi:hypothetical protein
MSLRIVKLSVEGSWLENRIVTSADPYLDDFITIGPAGSSTVNQKAKIQVHQTGRVTFLYNTKKPRPILCHKGNKPSIFVELLLEKQKLHQGSYVCSDNCIFLIDDKYLLIVNTPDPETSTRPTLNEIYEKPFDPNLLWFSSVPLERKSS